MGFFISNMLRPLKAEVKNFKPIHPRRRRGCIGILFIKAGKKGKPQPCHGNHGNK